MRRIHISAFGIIHPFKPPPVPCLRGRILMIKRPRINKGAEPERRNYLATSSPSGRCFTSLKTAMMNFNQTPQPFKSNCDVLRGF
ncbi:hypothetical protein CEXT_449361 [Caerostris extrusa]|uniref:Uncharacterized protein n=1 Tax=Caerostris extrusa TaxID=172846 RepID=A0AAV4UYI1_CAEEX|nr:hypothetical protein CEXT_449361 [Caerostris extrusa]